MAGWAHSSRPPPGAAGTSDATLEPAWRGPFASQLPRVCRHFGCAMSQKTATYHIFSFASADSDVRVHSGMSRGPCPVFVSVLRVGEATGHGLVEARPWGGACRAVAASADGGRLRVCVHGASYVPPGRLRSPHLAYRRDPRAGGHGASCGQTVERAARGSRFDSHLQRVASVELLGRGVSVRVRPRGWEQRHSRAGRWLWLSHGAWSSFSDST